LELPAVSSPASPAIDELYHRYLESEVTAQFVADVSRRYTLSTLARLSERGRYVTRRAATLAIGLIGDYRQNATLGRALHDRDRGVRLIADSGIRELWHRDGNARQQQALKMVTRLNHCEQYGEALLAANALINEAPWFAEAWNQRGIAQFALKRFEDSANDCHQTLELNAYHFGAAIGMAHCYLELEEPFAALECFRRALRMNPDLEDVRTQIDFLQRALEER
jgi:tetratricopeptide (TPR) repeat protein